MSRRSLSRRGPVLVEIIRLKSGRNNDAVAVQRASARLAVDGGPADFPSPASRLYPYLVLVTDSRTFLYMGDIDS